MLGRAVRSQPHLRSVCRRSASGAPQAPGASSATAVAPAAAARTNGGGGWGKAVATAAIAVILTAGTYHSLRDVINSYAAPAPKKLVGKEQFSVPTPGVRLQGSPQRDSELHLLLEDEGLPENRIILAVGPNGAGKTSQIRSCLAANGTPTLAVEPREYAALYRASERAEDEEPRSYLLELLTAALTPRDDAPKRPSSPEASAEAVQEKRDPLVHAQELYHSLSEAVKATKAGGAQPAVFIDNFSDLVTLAESEEDKQVLESLLCWILALAKNQGSAKVVLSSSDPFLLERLSGSVLDADIANEFHAAVTQVTIGENYTSNAAASMLGDLCKQYNISLAEEDMEVLMYNLGSSCSALSCALRALQEGCTLDQAIDWALAGTMEAAKALLQLEQGLLVWELMNVLAQPTTKNNLPVPRYATVEDVLASFKDKRQHPQVLELLHDARVRQMIFYYRRPTMEMVRAGAPAHLPHVGMTTATLRAFERLVKDDGVKREMWERRRK